MSPPVDGAVLCVSYTGPMRDSAEAWTIAGVPEVSCPLIIAVLRHFFRKRRVATVHVMEKGQSASSNDLHQTHLTRRVGKAWAAEDKVLSTTLR